MDVTDIISDGYLVGPQKSSLFSPDLKGITRTNLQVLVRR